MSPPIQELLHEWEAAEARLYPVAMTRPEAYARALTLIREIVAELAPCDGVQELADAYEDAAAIAARAVERSGVSTQDVDLGLAAAASFALRYRAIVVSIARREALERIRTAAEAGPGWVLVAESGDANTGPYVRLEMHLPDGNALQASVELDAETGERRFGLEALRLDPPTGERVAAAPTREPRTFDDPTEWDAAMDVLRASIEASSG